jgi:hypothetical protein
MYSSCEKEHNPYFPQGKQEKESRKVKKNELTAVVRMVVQISHQTTEDQQMTPV